MNRRQLIAGCIGAAGAPMLVRAAEWLPDTSLPVDLVWQGPSMSLHRVNADGSFGECVASAPIEAEYCGLISLEVGPLQSGNYACCLNTSEQDFVAQVLSLPSDFRYSISAQVDMSCS